MTKKVLFNGKFLLVGRNLRNFCEFFLKFSRFLRNIYKKELKSRQNSQVECDLSREKKVEKSLDFYKGILSVFLVALFSMIAFLYLSIDSLSRLKICLIAAGIVVVAVIVALLFRLCYKYLNELEKF